MVDVPTYLVHDDLAKTTTLMLRRNGNVNHLEERPTIAGNAAHSNQFALTEHLYRKERIR
ncbi:hypothetical protein Q427_22620 [Halomonas sp. BC04]|nr:hypothetical protein Q427_22620 [Halomonas sp. BC04]